MGKMSKTFSGRFEYKNYTMKETTFESNISKRCNLLNIKIKINKARSKHICLLSLDLSQ